MDENSSLPVHVPDGFALVPVSPYQGPGKVPASQDWYVAEPPYDPGDKLSVYWSRTMVWPRRAARTFLYLTYSYKRSGVFLAVIILVVLIFAYR